MSSPESNPQPPFRLGPWRVEPELSRLSANGESTQLEPKVMRVLTVLAQNAGELTTRAALLEEVWGNAYLGEDPTTRAVSELRKALDDDPRAPRFIETIHGKGYRLVAVPAPVDEPERPGASGRRRRLAPTLAAMAVVVALAAIVWTLRPRAPAGSEAVRPRPLTSFPGREHHPAVSPDGSRVAFAWGGGGADDQSPWNIYVKQRNSEKLLVLTEGPAWDAMPVWSPDGTEIAFFRFQDQRGAIYSAPAIGGAARPLHVSGRDFQGFDWSPDGRSLAVAEKRSGDAGATVYLVDLGDGSSRALTAPAAGEKDSAPQFSPDGRRLAVRRKLGEARYEIFVVELDGGETRRVTFDGQDNGGLAWAPSGKHLIVSSNRDGAFGLWRVALDGGDPERLGIEHAYLPAVARGTGELVFEKRGHDVDLWRAPNPHSGAEQPATPWATSTFLDLDPRYSPDGETVAFVSSRSGSFELWLAPAAGGGAWQLTFFERPLPGWSPAVQHPRWSLDGRSLVFAARAEGEFDVFTLDAAGGIPRPLTSSLADDLSPVWDGDGGGVYFLSRRDGERGLWRVDLGGEDLQRIEAAGEAVALDGPLDGWLYLERPDGAIERFAPATGAVETVVRSLDWARWTLGERHLFLVRGLELTRLPLDGRGTGESRALGAAGTPPVTTDVASSSFALSPDEAWVLYAGAVRQESDLMVVEGLFDRP